MLGMFRGSAPLFSPEGDAGTGVVTPPVEKKDEGIRKITVGGKEYTAEELETKMKAAETQQAALAASGIILDGSKTVAERTQAAKKWLDGIGVDAADQEQWIAENIGSEDDTVTTPAAPAKDPKDAQIAQLQADVNRARQVQLTQTLEAEVAKTLANDPEIGKLVAAAERLGGAEGKKNTIAAIRESLTQGALQNFRTKHRQTGQPLVEEWIGPGVKDSIPSVTRLVGAVIGDPTMIGKSSETSTRQRAPLNGGVRIETPKYKEGQSQGDLDQQVEKYWLQELMELADKVPDPLGSSKA